jgi:hypothetical protein
VGSLESPVKRLLNLPAGSPVRDQDVTETAITNKTTRTHSTVVTSPAGTNRYEHAAWSVMKGSSATVLFLQMLGISQLTPSARSIY